MCVSDESRERFVEETKETVARFLPVIPLFADLSITELEILANHMNYMTVKNGDPVFLEGDPGGYVCFVAQGGLEVSKQGQGGRSVILTTLRKGHSIGEMAVLEDAPRSASVVATSDSNLVTLTRESFECLLQNHPKVGISVLKSIARVLSANLRKTSDQLVKEMLPLC